MTIGGVLFCSSFGFFVLFCFVSFLFLFCFFVCIALAAATENTGAATGADMSKVAFFFCLILHGSGEWFGGFCTNVF